MDRATGTKVCEAMNNLQMASACLRDSFRRTNQEDLRTEIVDALAFLKKAQQAARSAVRAARVMRQKAEGKKAGAK